MRPFDEIVQIVTDLIKNQSPIVARMRAVLERYDGDWIVPIPDTAEEPELPPLTPALIGEAVDNMAMRAASVRPRVTCAAIDPMKDTGVRSREYATMRRRILAATYHESKWLLGRRRFYRQLSAYHTGSLVVVPDFKAGLPRIEVRDPLATFAEPQAAEQLRAPEYVAFVTRHSGQYLRHCYPQVREEVGGPITRLQMTEMWEVVEWFDRDQTVFGLLGPVHSAGVHVSYRTTVTPWMQLSPAYPNPSGLIPAVVPSNVSLGKMASRIAAMLGNVDLQARLMALDILAQEKAIFPDMYAIGRQSQRPQIVGGAWKDGREGDINLLVDVEQVGVLRQTPDIRTSQTVDRLERNFRVSTSTVPQFGGETYGALRTGRGIDALAGMAVDPRVQELHEVSEVWLPHLNEAIFDCYKTYWPDKKYTLVSGWPGDTGQVDFVPNTHIETYANTVSYTVAGADVVQQTQILGSLFGTKAISRRTFRAKHPWIDDPEREGALVDEEEFEDALKATILQQIAAGALPLVMAAKIRGYMAKGEDIFTAVERADEEARRIQASQPPPTPEGMALPPEAAAGLAAGPQAFQAPSPEPAPQVEVPGDVTRMRQLMAQMAPV